MPRMPLEFDLTKKKCIYIWFCIQNLHIKIAFEKFLHSKTMSWHDMRMNSPTSLYKLWFRIMIMDYPWTVGKQYVFSVIFISVAACFNSFLVGFSAHCSTTSFPFGSTTRFTYCDGGFQCSTFSNASVETIWQMYAYWKLNYLNWIYEFKGNFFFIVEQKYEKSIWASNKEESYRLEEILKCH